MHFSRQIFQFSFHSSWVFSVKNYTVYISYISFLIYLYISFLFRLCQNCENRNLRCIPKLFCFDLNWVFRKEKKQSNLNGTNWTNSTLTIWILFKMDENFHFDFLLNFWLKQTISLYFINSIFFYSCKIF